MSRPTKLDDLTVKKLEEAFLLGCTIEEACFNADISKQTYYNWTEQNPELLDRFEQLKLSPILKARKTVIKALEKDPKLAMRYLEKKLKYEFGDKEDPEIAKKKFKSAIDEMLEIFEPPPEPQHSI
jgi:hypothetical protein